MSKIQPIVAALLSSEAFEKVVEAITSGVFDPGQRISEAELARKLGVSRGPVREALGRLEGRLVRRTPRIGVHVISFTREDIEGLFITREALEGMAARLAAEHMTEDQLKHLRGLLEKHALQPELTSGEAYVQRTRDEDFHFWIIKCARCGHLERLLMDEIYYQMRIQRRISSTRPGRAKAALNEHRRIVEALEGRDQDAAEAAMRAHLRNARLSVIASFEDTSKTRSEKKLATG